MSTEELTAEEQQAMTDMETVTQNDVPAAPQEAAEPEAQPQEQPEPQGEAAEGAEEQAGPQAGAKPSKPPEGFVPHQAMHAERQRRQQLEQEIAEIKAKLAEQEQPQEQPPQYVDPLEDPEGFRKYSEYQETKRQEAVDQFLGQQKQSQERIARANQAARMEAEFAEKTPDYAQAVQSLHEARVSALQNAGYSQQEIVQQIQADAESIFNAAQSVGMNPAQLLYMRAQEAGYRPQAQQAQAQASSQAEQIVAKAKAQEQTQGLGSAGGGEQGGKVTAAQLAEMSEEELAKVPPDDIRRAMGG